MSGVDLVVVGAGVVGLAIARAAAARGLEVVVLEKNGGAGEETSSRNSEVIHAGIYYPPGSLKAKMCIDGRRRLYDYARARGIAHRRIGKFIVATSHEDEERLSRIAGRAAANGLEGAEALRPVGGVELRRHEPELGCRAALFSPATGIIDSHALMAALQADAASAGAVFAFGAQVSRIEGGKTVSILGTSRAEDWRLEASRVIVAAGLHAAALMRACDLPAPAYALLKGNYMALKRPPPFRHLIYPVPVPGGLGIHLTLDLAGNARFGPDTEPVANLDYRVDPARIPEFETAIRRWWPALPDGALLPAYAGIRPKLKPPAGAEGDFVIDEPAEGVVVLHGIESPGLTSCLALAEATCCRLGL